MRKVKKRMVIRMIKFIIGVIVGHILGVGCLCLVQGGTRGEYVFNESEIKDE